MSIKETKDGTTITIFVKPHASKFSIERDGDEIVVSSTQEPTKGKVNKEILKEISKLLGFRIEIVSGLTSRQKVLLIRGADKAQVEATLEHKVAARNC